MEAVLIPGEVELDGLKELTRSGKMLQAWERVRGMAPLKDWPAGKARDVASRVAAGLGADRLSDALDLLNWRQCREDHDAFLQAQFTRLRRGRMMEVQDVLAGRLELEGLTERQRAWMMALDGWIDGFLGDFAGAHAKTEAALTMRPQDSWLHVEKGLVLEREDRYEEALDFARQAVELRRGYRPAVMLLVDVLTHLHRDEEAEEVLLAAHEETEHHSYVGRLQAFYSEREDHERGLWCLDQFEARAPLLEKESRKWVAGRRSDFHYMAGRIAECIEWGEKQGKGFHAKVMKRLREPETAQRTRKRLDVRFIRQHRMTCAPATLASIAAYWGKEHDHVVIADAICYEGTPWHKERNWARENGFHVREFRVTREAAMALIDREVPFTLTTSWVTGAHLQACIGYDDRQGTLLLRDPTHRHFGEVLVEGLIKDHPVDGPRGMVLVPVERADVLDGVVLPDEGIYDANHDLSCALDGHDRLRAAGALGVMRALSPEHPMVLDARNRLAGYDGDAYEQVRVLEALVKRFPKSEAWKYRLLGALQRAGGARDRRLALMAEVVGTLKCDPVFYAEYGELLTEDAREERDAEWYLRKAARRNPRDGRNYASLAYLYWKMERRGRALRCRRVASCLTPGFEGYAEEFFRESRWAGQPDEGLAFLRSRVERIGAKSSGPWLTLAEALDATERDEEAQGVLEEALTKLPDDGELLLAAGRMLHKWGWRERAEESMQRARGKVPEARWFREAAGMATYSGNRVRALECYRRVVELQPARVDAHRSLAVLLEEEEGRARVLKHLGEVTNRYPEDVALLGLHAEWLGKEEPGRSLDVLRKLLALSPNYLWARRELAWQLDRAGELDEALREIGVAIGKGPLFAQGYGMKGGILYRAHRYGEAMQCFEQAVRLDVDYDYGVNHLMSCAERLGKVEETLALLREEMERQVSDGSVVTTYRQRAYAFVGQAELLEQLRGFCRERPDLWETWSAVSRHALDMGDLETAGVACEKLVKRFPLLPRAWVERSAWYSVQGRYDEEIADLERAVELSPAWDWAARKLAEVLERVGRYDEAAEVLERAVRWEPLVPPNYGYLAELLWRLERRGEAFDWLAKGVERCPSYEWGWGTLASWAVSLEREEEVEALLGKGRARQGWKANWWLVEADVLDNMERVEESLAAVEEGLALDPREQDLHDRRATILADLGRYEEALAACKPDVYHEEVPRELLGRRAWVQMEAGQPVQAIASMKKIVAEHPDYGWAQRQLMSWLSNRQDWAPLRVAAKNVTRLEPSNAVAWGYLAEAESGLENTKEARVALERAFGLDPEYTFAGRRLMDFEIADKDYVAAHRTLASLEHYSPSGWITADGIDLALAEKDFGEAERRAREILTAEEIPVGALGYAESLFEKAGRKPDWDGMLAEVMDGGDPGEAALEHWSQQVCAHGKVPKGIRKLERLKAPFDRKAGAWSVFLYNLADHDMLPQFRKLMAVHGEEFRGHPETWGAAGYGLLADDNTGATLKWFGNWRERGEAMTAVNLLNYTAAIDRVDGPDAARDEREEGLRRWPQDEHAPCFRAGLAWCAARAGDLDTAEEHLDELELDRMMDFYQGVAHLARAMVAAQRNNEGAAGTEFIDGLKLLGDWRSVASSVNYVRASADVLARHLPWAKGKAKRILKRYGKLAGTNDGSPTAGEWLGKWWWVLLPIYFVVRIALALVG